MAQHAITRSSRAYVATSRALIFLAAFVSFALSVTLWFTSDHLQGIFVGLWVPSILALGAIVLPRGERS